MRKRRKLVSLIVAFMLALSIFAGLPLAPPATAASLWDSAALLNVGDTYTLGTPIYSITDPTSNPDQRYYIHVKVPSVVVLTLSTEAKGIRNNMLELWLGYGDENYTSYDLNDNGVEFPEVDDTKAPLTKDFTYKLMPGNYYVHVWWWGSPTNGYGTFTFKSITPAKPQTAPADNYTINQGMANAPIIPGKTYDGLINWKATLPITPLQYGQYKYNFYKYIVKNNNTTLKLTASRADTTRNNDIAFKLCTPNGAGNSNNQLSLWQQPAGTALFKNIQAGTYLIFVDGWPSDAYTTEYSFKVDETVYVQSVLLPKTKTVDKGKTITLAPSFTPAGSTNKAATWKSSNPAIAKVSSTGIVTGKKGGTANITVTAKDGNKTAACTVTVREKATKLTLNKSKLTLKKGKTYKLRVSKFTPATVFPKKVKWASSFPKIVSVNKSGVIKAIKKGKAKITVKTWNNKTAKCAITVK